MPDDDARRRAEERQRARERAVEGMHPPAYLGGPAGTGGRNPTIPDTDTELDELDEQEAILAEHDITTSALTTWRRQLGRPSPGRRPPTRTRPSTTTTTTPARAPERAPRRARERAPDPPTEHAPTGTPRWERTVTIPAGTITLTIDADPWTMPDTDRDWCRRLIDTLTALEEATRP